MNRGDRRGFKRTLNDETTERFKELLSDIGLNLENKLNTEVGLLSGGQRQVIALLMATIRKPKLLLLDEHIAALDPKATEVVMTLTEKIIQEQNITSLMITHNMQHAIDYGNRLIMMDAGKIVLDIEGAEKHNLTVPELIETFHKEAGKALLADQMLL